MNFYKSVRGERDEMELTKTDLHFIMSRCPKDITKALKLNPGKLFIGGGFIRAVLAGEKISDVDLFGPSREELLTIAKDLTLARKGRFFKTDNAITVLKHPRIPVQFITRWLFSDPKTLIDSFDFTICQAVIWAKQYSNKKICFKSLTSDTYYSDLAVRRLVYTSPVREEAPGGSMLRVIKFIKKGYNIQPYSLAGVTARLLQAVRLTEIPEIDTQEEWAQKVITGLLREVDPMIIVDGVDFLDEETE